MYKQPTVFTGLAALHWLLTIYSTGGRLLRWISRLAEFDFKVKYKKCKTKTQVDAISRLHTTSETKPENFYAAMDDPTPSDANFEPIGVEKLL